MSARKLLNIIAEPPPEVQANIAALPFREPVTLTASLADYRKTVFIAVNMLTRGY